MRRDYEAVRPIHFAQELHLVAGLEESQDVRAACERPLGILIEVKPLFAYRGQREGILVAEFLPELIARVHAVLVASIHRFLRRGCHSWIQDQLNEVNLPGLVCDGLERLAQRARDHVHIHANRAHEPDDELGTSTASASGWLHPPHQYTGCRKRMTTLTQWAAASRSGSSTRNSGLSIGWPLVRTTIRQLAPACSPARLPCGPALPLDPTTEAN